MATINLDWTAISNKDWISVFPTEGSGNYDNLQIIITPAASEEDTETAGTVTITCTSCPEEVTKVINVTRCPYVKTDTDCDYKIDSIRYVQESENQYIDACDTSFHLPIKRVTHYKSLYSDPSCPDYDDTSDEYLDSATIGLTITENTGGTAVERIVFQGGQYYPQYPDTVKVIQRASTDGCASCSCGLIIISIGNNETVKVGYDALTNTPIGTITPKQSCIQNIKLTLLDENQNEVSEEIGKVIYDSQSNMVRLTLSKNDNCYQNKYFIDVAWESVNDGVTEQCPGNGSKRLYSLIQEGKPTSSVDITGGQGDKCDDTSSINVEHN